MQKLIEFLPCVLQSFVDYIDGEEILQEGMSEQQRLAGALNNPGASQDQEQRAEPQKNETNDREQGEQKRPNLEKQSTQDRRGVAETRSRYGEEAARPETQTRASRRNARRQDGNTGARPEDTDLNRELRRALMMLP